MTTILGVALLAAAVTFIVWITKTGQTWGEWAVGWLVAIAFTAAVYVGLALVLGDLS